ncbi:hypothetical protein BgAZ_305120 [Babesia gibsoni]|uniref:Uncharacterized protein n=1 Tax=Babesia gibsoni TaxID=33632 RepID=A0AAD8LIT9_BABGI|nr:hypothetical protein BgAZ_305120 [Babesia gibsoni]
MLLKNVIFLLIIASSAVAASGGDGYPQNLKTQLDWVARFSTAYADAELEYRRFLVGPMESIDLHPLPYTWDNLRKVVEQLTYFRSMMVGEGSLVAADTATSTKKQGITPTKSLVLLEFLPDMYATLVAFQHKLTEWIQIRSAVSSAKRSSPKLGSAMTKQWLLSEGFDERMINGDVELEVLSVKLEEVLGKDSPMERVLASYATDALLNIPRTHDEEMAWLSLFSSSVENQETRKKLVQFVDNALPKMGATFVDHLKKVPSIADIPREQIPPHYRFPGRYANTDVANYWLPLSAVCSSIKDSTTPVNMICVVVDDYNKVTRFSEHNARNIEKRRKMTNSGRRLKDLKEKGSSFMAAEMTMIFLAAAFVAC